MSMIMFCSCGGVPTSILAVKLGRVRKPPRRGTGFVVASTVVLPWRPVPPPVPFWGGLTNADVVAAASGGSDLVRGRETGATGRPPASNVRWEEAPLSDSVAMLHTPEVKGRAWTRLGNARGRMTKAHSRSNAPALLAPFLEGVPSIVAMMQLEPV